MYRGGGGDDGGSGGGNWRGGSSGWRGEWEAEGGSLVRSFVRSFEVVEERVGQTIPRPRARRASFLESHAGTVTVVSTADVMYISVTFWHSVSVFF